MRISDWSSDVCSSDLLHRVGTERRRQTLRRHDLHAVAGGDVVLHVAHHLAVWLDTEARFERQLGDAGDWRGKLGKAACRERVCQYVCITVGRVSLKKKQQKHTNSDNYT